MITERQIKSWLKKKNIKTPQKLSEETFNVLQKLYELEEIENELTNFFLSKRQCK